MRSESQNGNKGHGILRSREAGICAGIAFLFLGGIVASLHLTGQETKNQQARDLPRRTLEEILNKESEYCRRLELAALDFVCLEVITEKINQSRDIKFDQRSSFDGTTDGSWVRPELVMPPSKVKRTFLYDFQFVRNGGRIIETRTMLEENGKKKKEENAKLKTANFTYQSALLGPLGIFGARWHELYNYQTSGVGKVADRPVVIIDVAPKAPHPEVPFLFGRAFVDKGTLDILRIEWSDQRIGNFAAFERRGKRYKMTPKISVVSEFGVEKNGIRFPSRHWIEEAYIDKKGRRFVRSETSVIYKDFKFFTVSVDKIEIR